jgi:hypothetical protein
MGVISFAQTDADTWLAARWAYSRILRDTIATHADDGPLVAELEQAIALDGLSFDLLEPSLARKAAQAIKCVASATARGIDLPGMRWREDLDEDGTRIYQEGVHDLLSMIQRQAQRPG